MKLNEISSKKCWVILDLDDGSHAKDVDVYGVYLSGNAAEKAHAALWLDMVTDEIDEESMAKLQSILNANSFNRKKFEKIAYPLDIYPMYDDFEEQYVLIQCSIKG